VQDSTTYEIYLAKGPGEGKCRNEGGAGRWGERHQTFWQHLMGWFERSDYGKGAREVSEEDGSKQASNSMQKTKEHNQKKPREG